MAQQENKNTFYRKHRSLWQIQDGNTDVAVKMQHWYSKLPLHGSSCPAQTTVELLFLDRRRRYSSVL